VPPGQDRQACGQPACFTFALKLVVGQATIEACAPLFRHEYRLNRERLLQMIEASGISSD
jgi:ArsR family metal-binding transcriptional regulator